MTNTTLLDMHGRSEADRKELRAKVNALNAYAMDHWTDANWRKDMAADMTEAVYRGFEHENLLPLLGTVENVGFNDRVHMKEVRGLRAFWVARGGYIEASEMHAEVVEMPRDTIGYHVYEMEDKLMVNFAETQATLVSLGKERLNGEVNKRAMNLFQAAAPSNGSASNYAAASGLSLTAVNAAIRQVRENSSQFNVTIVGRNSMTEQILDELTDDGSFSGFIPETNEQILNTGIMGVYRGARILTLNNFRDDTETSFFPANELFVIAPDAAKYAFFGGMLSKEWIENDAWYWHYATRLDFGGFVHRPSRIFRLVDNTIAP